MWVLHPSLSSKVIPRCFADFSWIIVVFPILICVGNSYLFVLFKITRVVFDAFVMNSFHAISFKTASASYYNFGITSSLF
jgi:hypothetical protein